MGKKSRAKQRKEFLERFIYDATIGRLEEEQRMNELFKEFLGRPKPWEKIPEPPEEN